MPQIFLTERLSLDSKLFFIGTSHVTDAELAALGEKYVEQILVLPPGTVPRGLNWLDAQLKPHIKWVAYVE